MDFNDAEQLMVERNRNELEGLTYPQIVKTMVSEAEENGYKPMDFNWAGKPNIYLRGRFAIEEDGSKTWIEDLFIMFIERIE